VNWIWWVSIGFVLGLNCGVALSGLLRFSSERQKNEALRKSLFGAHLDGPSTIF
jgi:hypothetical protein